LVFLSQGCPLRVVEWYSTILALYQTGMLHMLV